MKTLKNSKTTGRIISCEIAPSRLACNCTTETICGKKVEVTDYTVNVVKQGEQYTVSKKVAGKVVETYITDIWENTCECEGYANGYNCRHLRLINALKNSNKVK